jgi:hypothetical protein
MAVASSEGVITFSAAGDVVTGKIQVRHMTVYHVTGTATVLKNAAGIAVLTVPATLPTGAYPFTFGGRGKGFDGLELDAGGANVWMVVFLA